MLLGHYQTADIHLEGALASVLLPLRWGSDLIGLQLVQL